LMIRLDPHVYLRLPERNATEAEVKDAVRTGKRSRAKGNRWEFSQEFVYNATWNGKFYKTKKVEAIAVRLRGEWLVVTVITKFY
jgi:hypothetical protein